MFKYTYMQYAALNGPAIESLSLCVFVLVYKYIPKLLIFLVFSEKKPVIYKIRVVFHFPYI